MNACMSSSHKATFIELSSSVVVCKVGLRLKSDPCKCTSFINHLLALFTNNNLKQGHFFFLSAMYVVSFLFTLEKIFNTSTQSFTMNNAKQCYFEKRRLMSESSDTTDEAMTSSDLFHSLTALNVKWLDLLTKST